MPMIDVYAAEGTFASRHDLAQQLAAAVMRWEQVPPIALFEKNTAAFVHDLPGPVALAMRRSAQPVMEVVGDRGSSVSCIVHQHPKMVDSWEDSAASGQGHSS